MSESGTELPGAELRRVREERGMTREEVSEHLHLSMSYLQALEEDDYGRLPEPPFIKGYLRNYARLLGLPGEELASRFQQHVNQNRREPVPTESLHEPLSNRRDWRWPLLLVLLVLLLLVLAWWLWPSAGEPEPPGTYPDTVEESVVPEAAPAAPADTGSDTDAPTSPSEPSLDSGTTTPEPVMEPSSNTEDNSSDSGVEAVESQAGTPEPTSEAGADSETGAAVAAAGGDRLELAFSRDCWIRVVDATGKRLVEGVQSAGDRVSLNGEAPYRLTVGDAAAVSEMTLNGKAETLPGSGSGQVLRFSLP
ncbi:hypothetical protein B5T_01193 [Alloalcanivorax dieselolei B5]|uniref:HTH cro/C1-type domain-containing protein n=1 Tax=Alcanivorax dieselolei (strain DSM 16502 / CGMCC 1.3690 / MCCC 1A00001 / B-5) TaxID=930169 RepID=K0CD27_ALCDB|nr:RodZ domain-containing protein [Alloalcanivorax dieselolei]AFT69476.1 hypothetical protein B5T_01193 [Alloalcanivorax dieselolei B5]GGJ93066.1 cytoskeleton protein RodZ [Alloalcanivorax dieselolei]